MGRTLFLSRFNICSKASDTKLILKTKKERESSFLNFVNYRTGINFSYIFLAPLLRSQRICRQRICRPSSFVKEFVVLRPSDTNSFSVLRSFGPSEENYKKETTQGGCWCCVWTFQLAGEKRPTPLPPPCCQRIWEEPILPLPN